MLDDNTIISKELLSEVLGRDVQSIQKIGNNINYVIPNYEIEEDGELVFISLGTNINIHELENKCKKWLFKKYKMYINIYNMWLGVHNIICEFKNVNNIWIKTIQIETIDKNNPNLDEFLKPEYTFKVCQWVLDNE